MRDVAPDLRSRRTPAWRSIAAVLLALAVFLLGSPGEASAALPAQYYDGVSKYSSVINCPSLIFGSPYTEFGIGAYTGYYAHPDANYPQAGKDAVYMHLVVVGLGNPCGGGTYFWPSFKLPAGVSWFTGADIKCFYDGNPLSAASCPQWTQLKTGQGPNGSDWYQMTPGNTQTWGVAQGHTFEFLLPIHAPGGPVTSGRLDVFLQTADGNSSPTLNPWAPIYFFGPTSPPSVLYDSPSTTLAAVQPGTTTPTKYGLLSQAQVMTQGHVGRLFLDIGATTNYELLRTFVPGQTSGSYTSYSIWTDWDEAGLAALQPGQRYYWRAGFDPGDPGGGDVVYGAQQSFVVPMASTCRGKPITVSLALGHLPTDGNDVILGTPGDDEIQGGGGDDTICGGPGVDALDGGDGTDTVDGGEGDDVLFATTGNDTVVGGPGSDVLSYAGLNAAVKVSLGTTAAQNTIGAGTDTISTVEHLVGGNGGDILTGSMAANTITGGMGDDVINGSLGRDTVSYAGATAGEPITVDLRLITKQGTGMGFDKLAKVENVIGGAGADRLTGNELANTLVGNAGTDTCTGGAGLDKAQTCEIVKGVP